MQILFVISPCYHPRFNMRDTFRSKTMIKTIIHKNISTLYSAVRFVMANLMFSSLSQEKTINIRNKLILKKHNHRDVKCSQLHTELTHLTPILCMVKSTLLRATAYFQSFHLFIFHKITREIPALFHILRFLTTFLFCYTCIYAI